LEIRDPIHGFIQPEGIEIDLLDSMPMQRLRGIKQLALASLVYPGAHHTRFEHSLGAMHVADRMAKAVGLTGERRRLVRLATLLHDLGHGPFSHVAEQLLERFGNRDLIDEARVDAIHERITLDVIRRDPGIRRVLGRRLDPVIGLIQKSDIGSVERDIVSGPM
jgi:HD superfamily phosphohydrolase